VTAEVDAPASFSSDDPTLVALEKEIQRAAEEHLIEVERAMDQDFSDPDREEIYDPSFAPFCGCTTCIVREVLMAAEPHFRAYYRALEARRGL
jgi:hypothetical protein